MEAHLIAWPAARCPTVMTTGPCGPWRARSAGVGIGGVFIYKKNTLKPWLKKQWCIPVGGDGGHGGRCWISTEPFRRGRWSALTRPPPSLADVREPLPANGRPRREDYATCSSLGSEPRRGWRHVAIRMQDFAQQCGGWWMRPTPIPVIDNEPHRMASLYETFPIAKPAGVPPHSQAHG